MISGRYFIFLSQKDILLILAMLVTIQPYRDTKCKSRHKQKSRNKHKSNLFLFIFCLFLVFQIPPNSKSEKRKVVSWQIVMQSQVFNYSEKRTKKHFLSKKKVIVQLEFVELHTPSLVTNYTQLSQLILLNRKRSKKCRLCVTSCNVKCFVKNENLYFRGNQKKIFFDEMRHFQRLSGRCSTFSVQRSVIQPTTE